MPPMPVILAVLFILATISFLRGEETDGLVLMLMVIVLVKP